MQIQVDLFFTHIINSLGGQEKISDMRFVGQDSSNNTKNIECRSSQLAFILNDSHKTVCDNSNINLDLHSVLCIAPEGCAPEMLLYRPKNNSTYQRCLHSMAKSFALTIMLLVRNVNVHLRFAA